MSQIDLLTGQETRPDLTPKQRRAHDYLAQHPEGVYADELGALYHRHGPDARCDFCGRKGLSLLRSQGLGPLVTYRRTPHGRRYVLRDQLAPLPVSSSGGVQLQELPGSLFEDIFKGAA